MIRMWITPLSNVLPYNRLIQPELFKEVKFRQTKELIVVDRSLLLIDDVANLYSAPNICNRYYISANNVSPHKHLLLRHIHYYIILKIRKYESTDE